MRYLNREDKQTRKIVDQYFHKKLEIKNQKLKNKQNQELQQKLAITLAKLPRRSGLTRPKNRCVISCKGRATLRRFRVSHTVLREEYAKGNFPGVFQKSF